MKGFQWISMEEMYQKHPDLKPDDVKLVQKWLESQPHLPKITDLEVANFLHANYFRVEATKNMIDNYYTYRTHLTNFFKNRDITGDDMVETHDVINFFLLPERTPDNHQIIIYRFKDTDPNRYSFVNFIKIIGFSIETELLEKGPPDGFHLVLDVTGVKLGHITRANLSETKLSMLYLQEGLPIRIVGLHFINVIPFMDRLMALIRPFAKNDLAKKLYVHESVKGLHEFAPPEIFPRDYEGGKEISIDEMSEKYYQLLVQRREHFLEEEKTRRVNEKLRPTKSRIVNDYFGLEGTFKKLDID
ncbi:clavesin-1-like [Culicoides brevitarsis]|uniref:clavesin-1-like n=1 Tax=Culicoides brevitarsis TaxID=469753 RepID=UPI00307BCF25